MFAALTIGGLAAAGCGYHALKRYQQSIRSLSLEKQIQIFKEAYPDIFGKAPGVKLPVHVYSFFDVLMSVKLPWHATIFDLIEAETSVAGFSDSRKLAEANFCSEDCRGDFDEIYKHLSTNQKFAGKDLEPLKKLECELLKKHLIPVKLNFQRLLKDLEENHHIIIIEDSPYPSALLREMLPLTTEQLEKVQVFTSRSGVIDQWIFQALAEVFELKSYTGLSLKYQPAIPRIVKTDFAHLPTATETTMFRFGTPGGWKAKTTPEVYLASLIRELSLLNPYDRDTDKESYFLYRVHAMFTMPVIWFFLHNLKNYLAKNPGIKRLVFLSRSSVHIEKLIPLINKDIEVRRIDCSKLVLEEKTKNADDEFVSYVRENLGENPLVIGIYGKYSYFSTFCQTYFNKVPLAYYCSPKLLGTPRFAYERFTTAIPGIDSDIFRRLLCTRTGPVISWCQRTERSDYPSGAIRAPCEYEDKYINMLEKCIGDFLPRISKDFEGNGVDLPRARSMAALLQKASVTLQGVIEPLKRPNRLESGHYERLLSWYNDKSLTVLNPEKLKLPLLEQYFTAGRCKVLTKADEPCDILVCSKIGQSVPKTFLVVCGKVDDTVPDWQNVFSSEEFNVFRKVDPTSE